MQVVTDDVSACHCQQIVRAEKLTYFLKSMLHIALTYAKDTADLSNHKATIMKARKITILIYRHILVLTHFMRISPMEKVDEIGSHDVRHQPSLLEEFSESNKTLNFEVYV